MISTKGLTHPKMLIHLRDTCTQLDWKDVPDGIKMGDLPWIKNAPLTVHMVDAIATATIFLFQIATLAASINAYFGKKIVTRKTYMRSTSKKDAAERARYEGT